jgi:hypothetical protein
LHTRIIKAASLLLLLCASWVASPAARAADGSAWVQAFTNSQFQFRRSESNVPNLQLAWFDATHYGSTELHNADGGIAGSYEQDAISQGLLLPLVVGDRDMVVVGDWISFTQLQADTGSSHDVDVLSIGLPLGWMRQTSESWQLAAFVAPLAHRATDRSDPWYWETLGGAFALYWPPGRWMWIFGAYADVSSSEEFYIPYAGGSFQINPRWTLSLVLPWPALIYAPSKDWMLLAGLTPAGATWAAKGPEQTVVPDQDALNLGLAVERRVWRDVWLRVEGGVSGYRGFGFIGSDWEGPNAHAGTSPYVTVRIGFRPPAIKPAR